MDCLAVILDVRHLVDEAYKDCSGSEHGIYQACKTAAVAVAGRFILEIGGHVEIERPKISGIICENVGDPVCPG
jgi:hypothetical protein